MSDRTAVIAYSVAVALLLALTREGMHMPSPAQYAKAIVGALVAALTALGAAVADGSVTAVEWVTVAVALVATFGAVFATPNRQASE